MTATPSPFAPEQEARIRDIVREEIDADYALGNSRDHVEFLVEVGRMGPHRRIKEAKRTGVEADA